MKRVAYLTAIVVALVTASAVFFLNSYDFKSEGSNFTITKASIDATVYQDASMDVISEYHYRFHQSGFTFLYQAINKKGIGSITDIVISQNGQPFQYVESRDCYNATLAPKTYCIGDEGSRYIIGWGIAGYSNGDNEYTVSYKAQDVAQVYRDFTLLDYQFIGDETPEPIRNISIDLHLPVDKARKDEVYLFGHNNYGGNINMVDGSHAQFEVPYNGPNTFVEVTTLFPSDVMKVMPKDQDILESRLALEKSFQEETKAKFKSMQQTGYMIYGVVILISIIVLLTALLHRKKYKPIDLMMPEYQREIDVTIPPAKAHAVYNIIHGKYQVSTAISATLLSLVYKKAIDLDFEGEDAVYKNNLDESIVLDETEQLLYDFIFGVMTNEDVITQKEFKKAVNRHGKQASEFYDRFDRVVKKSIKGYRDDMSQSSTMTFIIIGAIISVFATMLYYTYAGFVLMIMPLIVIALSGIAIILVAPSRLLTPKGQEQYDYWAAVHKFFKDFSRLDDYELPQYIMWEQYMVYAVALDVADDVIRQLKVSYPQYMNASNQPSILRTYMNVQLYRAFSRSMMGNVVTSSRSSYRQTQSVNGIRSSGRGGFSGGFGGGGFSGGGGFGGGGGGFGVR